MSAPYSYDDGRVWIQLNKFESYTLLLPYGMTDVTDPVGSTNLVREPSPSKRRESIVVDILRGEPGQNSFNIETRLRQTLNYMFGLRSKKVNFQAHLGACGRPDNYNASQVGLLLPECMRGDLSLDRLSQIQGDNSPISMTVPWTAEGLEIIDFETEFLSARTIAETENLNAVAFIKEECGEGYNPGDYGYTVADAAGAAEADVFVTTDGGESWAAIADKAFAADEHISSVVVSGTPYDHRVIVACGTTDAAAPAKVAYAEVGEAQTVTWVDVAVGSTNGQYINKLFLLDYANVYAVCDDGQIYHSSDGGASWSSIKAATAAVLSDIAATRDGLVIAVGASNTVLLSEDFGASWTSLTVATATFTACEVTDDGTLFVGDSAGVLYGSYDGGFVWHTLPLQGVTGTAVNAIMAYGNDIIWAAVNIAGPAGRILRSTDGGANFRLWKLNIPTNDGANGIDIVDANYMWVAGDTGFITRTNSTVIGV